MSVLAQMSGLGGRDMAVDLGSANTLVYVRGDGIVLWEPSVVAVDSHTGAVRAVGVGAQEFVGRSDNGVAAVRPVRNGVIADFELTERLLAHLIHEVHRYRWAHPRIVMCVPAGVTSVHTHAVGRACLSAGARQAYLIEGPIAAAIGTGLPVWEPAGSMILDIGGGITEVAVISVGGIVVSESVAVGGDQLDDAIIGHLKREHKLMIDRRTAEQVKLEFGSAFPLGTEVEAEVSGVETVSEMPKTVRLTSGELRAALEKPVAQIIRAVRDTLARTPPELAADIIDRGIVLVGGGSLLRGLPERLRHEMQMPAQVGESPRTCVARGSGRWLEHVDGAGYRRSAPAGAVPVGAVAAMR
jgi:rod shape-determining protein MreB and related proteins